MRKVERVGGEEMVTDYGYDAASRLERVAVNGRETERYRYDAQGRRSHDRQAVDARGGRGRNVSGRTFVYARGDRLTGAGLGRRLEYDAKGRIVADRSGGDLLVREVGIEYAALSDAVYDRFPVDLPVRFELRETNPALLRPVRLPHRTDGDAQERNAARNAARKVLPRTVPVVVVEYAYDRFALRRACRVDGVVREYVDWHDPVRPARIRDDQGRVVALFRYRNAAAWQPHAVTYRGETLTLHYDHIGSLRAVVNRHGDIVRQITHEAFGAVTRDTNPDLFLGLGFAGGWTDPDTGLVRFWLRDYDPDLGRFTTPDPAWGLRAGVKGAGGEGAGGKGGQGAQERRRAERAARREADQGGGAVDPDRYGYCLDDPVNLSDPKGCMSSGMDSSLDDKATMSVESTMPSGIAKKEINTFSDNTAVNEFLSGKTHEWYESEVEGSMYDSAYSWGNGELLGAALESATEKVAVVWGASAKKAKFLGRTLGVGFGVVLDILTPDELSDGTIEANMGHDGRTTQAVLGGEIDFDASNAPLHNAGYFNFDADEEAEVLGASDNLGSSEDTSHAEEKGEVADDGNWGNDWGR